MTTPLVTVPPTAWIVALITEACSVCLEGAEPWTREHLEEHAYYLALTYPLEELVKRGSVLLEISAAVEEIVIREGEEDEAA